MRLWSIHPAYLDSKGLVALWREALLAQNVLLGKTRGYRQHPQLNRFRQSGNAAGAIASYLRSVADEADSRGYQFDRSKIAHRWIRRKLPVTRGQLQFEQTHLLRKLAQRDPERFHLLCALEPWMPHPLFEPVEGEIEPWEIV